MSVNMTLEEILSRPYDTNEDPRWCNNVIDLTERLRQLIGDNGELFLDLDMALAQVKVELQERHILTNVKDESNAQ